MGKIRGYDEFQCIADKCTDNCCHGWSITVDDKTWDKYRSATQFRDAGFLENVETIDLEGMTLRRLRLDAAKDCAFLNGGLCSLYLKLGEEYQTDVCRLHPRKIRDFCGEIEHSLQFDCPAVVRQYIMTTDKVQMISDSDNALPSQSAFLGFSCSQTKAIRDFTVDILHARETTLYDRLYLLANFSNFANGAVVKYGAACADSLVSSLPSLLESLTTPDHVAFSMPQDKATKDVRRQICELFAQTVHQFFADKQVPQDTQLNARISKMLKNVDSITPKQIEESYERNVVPYFAENSHILENMLVMRVYNIAFPTNYTSIPDAYNGLLFYLALFELYLALVYVDDNGIADDEMFASICYFAKCVDHARECSSFITMNTRLLNLGQLLNWLSFVQ